MAASYTCIASLSTHVHVHVHVFACIYIVAYNTVHNVHVHCMYIHKANVHISLTNTKRKSSACVSTYVITCVILFLALISCDIHFNVVVVLLSCSAFFRNSFQGDKPNISRNRGGHRLQLKCIKLKLRGQDHFQGGGGGDMSPFKKP